MKISVGQLTIASPQGQLIGTIPCTSCQLYRIVHDPDSAHTIELLSIMELHCHLGHIAPASAHKLIESGAVTGVELDPKSQETECDACIHTQSTRLPIPKVHIRPPAQHFGEEIHLDLWGPSSIATHQGRKYFISFTDDAMRYTVAFLLWKKSNALENYKSFKAWAITQGHCKAIWVLHSDHRGEYLSGAFDQHLAAAGTAWWLTVHDTPQLNGVAECLNCTLLERIRAFTYKNGLPKSLWGKGLRHTLWLKNRTATCALDGCTPYEALHGELPDLSGLWRWGRTVLMHHKPKDKLSSWAREGHWIGFDTNSHAHRIYWLSTCTVTVERDIYLGSTALLEGEPMAIPTVRSEHTVSRITTPPPPSPPDLPLTQLDSPISETPEDPVPFDDPAPATAPSQIDTPVPEEAPPIL